MRKISIIGLIAVLTVLTGCSNFGRSDREYAPIGEAIGIGDAGNGTVQPGQLSAGEWKDNDHYAFFLSLFASTDQQEGAFEAFKDDVYFDPFHRIEVFIHNEETPIRGVVVKLLDVEDTVIYQARTNVDGYAYLFPFEAQLEGITSIVIVHNDQTTLFDYTYDLENNSLSFNLDLVCNHQNIIELMFVIDTTGSMGDELSYLKAEIADVIEQIRLNNLDATIYLALLFYRDIGDTYVTRYFDFTTDVSVQQNNLSQQTAAGGGDFPEAVDIALDEAMSKQWNTHNTTKIIFHVLDAPPHTTQANMTRYHQAILKAAELGIQLIPVASSGIDTWTEYLLRNEAMMTNGTYVFLTNHSGIGDEKIEPSIGEYVPEYLNRLMVRLVQEFHTGERWEKVPFYSSEE